MPKFYVEAPDYVRHGKRTTTYYAVIRGLSGKTERINLGHDRAAADRKLAELVNGKPTAGTIADMCAQFIAHHRALIEAGDAELAESTLDDYENGLNKHVLPVFGAMPPAAFKPTHKAQYLKAQKEKKREIRANREMAALGSAFNYGIAMDMLNAKRVYDRTRTVKVKPLG